MSEKNIIIPQASSVDVINAKFTKFYGHSNSGNITVMNFSDNNGYSIEQIQNITNALSQDLKKSLKDPNVEVKVSIGVKFPFGYKSSKMLTDLGQDVDIWNPNEYDPDEEFMKKYNDPNLRAKSFDMYLIVVPRAGGCSGKYNDCFYDCIKKLTNGNLPDKINHPRKLKKFFGVGRKDLIDAKSPKMPELEKLLNNCNINIGGDDVFYTTHQPENKYYKYHINLKAGHYTPKHMPGRQITGFNHEERQPVIFKYVKNDDVEIYKGDKVEIVSKKAFAELKENKIPKEEKKTLIETYDDFIRDSDILKESTKDYAHPINFYRTGVIKNTILDLFNKMTYGLPEPDEIDEFEGKKLIDANRGGLQMCQPFEGKCYKYDFVSRYGSIMSSTKCIPMKKGTWMTMTQDEMDDKVQKKHTLKYGIYSCKVYKSNTKKDLLFGFNSRNEYTHEDLEIAIKYNLKIEMINKNNNCLIYDKSSLIPMDRIFNDYINYTFELKNEQLPYSKILVSRIWGVLSRKRKHDKKFKLNDSEIVEIDANWNPKYFKRDGNIITVTYEDSGKPFLCNWARIGTFLTSMARNKLAKFLDPILDDVVWAHTDGFILKKKLTTEKEFCSDKLHGLKYEGVNEHFVVHNMRCNGLKDFVL